MTYATTPVRMPCAPDRPLRLYVMRVPGSHGPDDLDCLITDDPSLAET